MRQDIVDAIESEREEQDRRFPHEHTPGEYLLIIRKLLTDAERVWYSDHREHAVMDEIRQITAIGVKAMEQHGSPMRVPTKSKAKRGGKDSA